ncbi:MAG: VWA domain-containing protein [Candidatus Omnitrophota bacterium]
MRFADFNIVYSLIWLVIVLSLFLVWSFRRRVRAAELFAEKDILDKLSMFDVRRYKIKNFIIITAVALVLFSFMRPQWGFHWQEVKRVGLDILIAIDTSKSMLAQDVKPNRLERSKLAVKDLIKKLKGDRIGLIAFSGSAFLQCPLTVDYSGFTLMLDDLDVDTIPKGGTSIASAISVAMKSYEGGMNKYKAIVIITDGEDHEGDVAKLAKEAEKEGVKIFCIGIGTREGELIPVVNRQKKTVFLKDREGNVIKTRLNERSLQEIASITGGSYVRATGAEFGLDLIYEGNLSKMEKRELESKMKKSYQERFQIPLALAFALLFLEPFIGQRRAKNGI